MSDKLFDNWCIPLLILSLFSVPVFIMLNVFTEYLTFTPVILFLLAFIPFVSEEIRSK